MLPRVKCMISPPHPLLCTLSYHRFSFPTLSGLDLNVQSQKDEHLENNHSSGYFLRGDGEEKRLPRH